MSGSERCDALIAGGGLAGGLAALALARRGFAVTLVESSEPAPAKSRGKNRDGRSISLSLASLRVLETLGLGDALAHASQPITTVHVSEAGHLGHLRFTAREMGVPALGRVVPADPLLAALMQGADAAGVQRLCPATVESTALAPAATSRTVTLADPDGTRTLVTRLLVVADGAGSALRDRLGIRHNTRRYGHVALVTTAQVARPCPGTAFERFTRDGTLAILPRAGDRVGVVWTVPEERVQTFTALPADAFLLRVTDALGKRLGTMQPVAPLKHFPLTATQAATQVAERAVVIGNAAHSLHPVAAQGFNLSVRDIAVLAECLADCDDAGNARALEGYARCRRRDQARTRAYTGFVRALGDLGTPIAGPARALGLLAAEFNRPLARALARQGMGLSSQSSPRLIRGEHT